MEPNRICNQPARSEYQRGTQHRCGRETKFFICGINADGTRWAEMVCGLHDRSIGRKNLHRAYPWMSYDDILRWDMEMGREYTSREGR